MDTSERPGDISHGRRRFLGAAGAAALGAGAAQLGMTGSAKAASGHALSGLSGGTAARASTAFGPVKQIKAGVLNVGYVEAGPANGRPVILMHGFPYDIHSYVEVAPLLAAEGYRVIVPYFRGYGTHHLPVRSARQKRGPGGVRAGHHRPDGRAEDRAGDPGRLRLGIADRRHHRGAVAAAGQGPGLGGRVPDHQSRRPAGAAAAHSGERLVVPVLLRHRTRRARPDEVPVRLGAVRLEVQLPDVEVLHRRPTTRPRRRSTTRTTSPS